MLQTYKIGLAKHDPGANSKNQPKGGRNSPQRYNAARFFDQFSQFIHLRSQEASSKLFICCTFVQNFVLIIAFYRFEDKK